jgi:hypothetical protein
MTALALAVCGMTGFTMGAAVLFMIQATSDNSRSNALFSPLSNQGSQRGTEKA